MTDNELLRAIYNDTQELKKDVEGLKEDVHDLKEDVEGLKEDVHDLKEDVHDLQGRTTSLELTLENETNKGIKIIAEGHLDLSRKLDAALRVENEKEMLLLRVTHLENELRKVKEQISQIA